MKTKKEIKSLVDVLTAEIDRLFNKTNYNEIAEEQISIIKNDRSMLLWVLDEKEGKK